MFIRTKHAEKKTESAPYFTSCGVLKQFGPTSSFNSERYENLYHNYFEF